jgi:outer membrane scaffolding protein for murein synthesis (MipA/OmpV family)
MRTTLIGVLALALSAELKAQEPPPPSSWNVTVGAAGLVFPRYPGSDEYRVLPFPMVQVTFRGRIFLGPSSTGLGFGVGAYAIRTRNLGLAVEVGGQDSRPASRADALAGLEDRDGVGTAGASLSYRAGPLEGVVGVTKGLNDGAGVLGSARVSVSQTLGRLMIAASTIAVVADGKQMRREFGVTDAEAGRRRALIAAGDDRLDPEDGNAYRPDGGLRHVGASVSLMYGLSPRWSLIGFGGVDRLSDEAAASPLVRRREQFSGGIGLGYRL